LDGPESQPALGQDYMDVKKNSTRRAGQVRRIPKLRIRPLSIFTYNHTASSQSSERINPKVLETPQPQSLGHGETATDGWRSKVDLQMRKRDARKWRGLGRWQKSRARGGFRGKWDTRGNKYRLSVDLDSPKRELGMKKLDQVVRRFKNVGGKKGVRIFFWVNGTGYNCPLRTGGD